MNGSSERRYLFLDIETIIDWALVGQVFGLSPDSTIEDLRNHLIEKYPSGFPPPPYHIPICIALIDVDYETCRVHNAAVIENSDERALLQQFWKTAKMRKGNAPVRSTLVHFNGRGFDLPVLFYRSLKHRVQVMPLERNRYSFESSHDICDDLADFGAASRPSLNVVSKMLGLPGKTEIDGSKVEDLYLAGERARIKDYCMDDALSTYYIWLTMKLTRCEMDEAKYREAFDSAAEIVRTCRTVTDSYFSGD